MLKTPKMYGMRCPYTQFLKCNSGVTAVEFAFVSPFFIIFTFAILNFGIYYYYSSIVEKSMFEVSRAILNPTTRPSDLATATALFNNAMSRYVVADLNGKPVIISINSVTASSPPINATAVSSYNVVNGTPIIIRVVYPRPDLPSFEGLIAAWPKIFGNSVDLSILVEPK